VTVPLPPVPPSPEEVRRRQLARARVMGLLLGALAILIFGISIAKIRAGML
jgi:hypothetical protein